MCVNLPSDKFFTHTPMAVNFYLEKRTDKKGEAPIRVSIMIKGSRLITSTGLKIDPAKWNEEKQRAKKGSYTKSGMTWAEINRTQDKITEHFNGIENDAIINGNEITPEFLKNEFSKVFRHKPKQSQEKGIKQPLQEKVKGFWDYFEEFIKETSFKNGWTLATHQKFNALKNHLKDWKIRPTFEDFTEIGFNEFIAVCRDKLQMKNSTIGNQVSFVKWFLRWATLKGYNTNITFQSFSPKLKTAQKKVVFLEWDELMKVLNYSVPPNGTVVKLRNHEGKEYEKTVHDTAAIEKTRDIFCFCCFTSLRYSDANNLKKSNISNNTITLTTIKTADTITIELNKYALAILEKYKDCDFGGYALPRITNQRMNIYLKDLCELCGINQLITQTYYKGAERIEETMPKFEMIGTHTGRRTFICNALMLGIPPHIVMKWTGHSDYKSMEPYIDVANQAKAQAMKIFDKL